MSSVLFQQTAVSNRAHSHSRLGTAQDTVQRTLPSSVRASAKVTRWSRLATVAQTSRRGCRMEKPVKEHLKKVYSSLAIAMLAAAAGAYVHLMTGFIQGGFLSAIASIGLLVWLGVTENSPSNQLKRLGIMTGFSFCVEPLPSNGTGIDHLFEHDTGTCAGTCSNRSNEESAYKGNPVASGGVVVRAIDYEPGRPSIIPTAFMATTVVFVSFSLSALWAENRYYLFLGGMLMSGVQMLLFAGLINLFFRSYFLFQAQLYVGLAIFCAFVLYDTQLIVEKRRRGDTDYIWHCVDLFLDFVNIFRRIMIILAQRQQEKKSKK
ncbi:Bax inhibitor 1 [Branchiostoma belcheri]|nr:Bax inhibitor 1 [Branchiostoma belcheri]